MSSATDAGAELHASLVLEWLTCRSGDTITAAGLTIQAIGFLTLGQFTVTHQNEAARAAGQEAAGIYATLTASCPLADVLGPGVFGVRRQSC